MTASAAGAMKLALLNSAAKAVDLLTLLSPVGGERKRVVSRVRSQNDRRAPAVNVNVAVTSPNLTVISREVLAAASR